MTIYYSHLPDRAVLAVSGEDARDFLQGLITKDVKKIGEGQAVFAALLSPQGRFLFDFFIIKRKDGFWLETDKTRLPELMKRLTMYRLRAKVELRDVPLAVVGLWGKNWNFDWHSQVGPKHPDDEWGYEDSRLRALGSRLIMDFNEIPEIPERSGVAATEGDYDIHRLSLGLPEGSKDLTVDRSILLEYGYDEMGAVDFDKGCYVGQEVTARSKHRATLRKFIHMVRSDGTLPPKGTPVMAGAREAGTMLSSAEGIGLAHLRVEEVARAHREGLPFEAGGVPLVAKLPDWCKTAFAEGVV